MYEPIGFLLMLVSAALVLWLAIEAFSKIY